MSNDIPIPPTGVGFPAHLSKEEILKHTAGPITGGLIFDKFDSNLHVRPAGMAVLYAALARAQAKIVAAKANKENSHFGSKYADLASIWEACRSALTAEGFCVIQSPESDDKGRLILRTTLAHSSGLTLESILPLNPTKNDPQGIGSAITYMRRYALASMVGVAPEDDDDGNGASHAQQRDKNKNQNDGGKQNQQQRQQKNQQQQQQPPKDAAPAGPSPQDKMETYVVPFGPLKGRVLSTVDVDSVKAALTEFHEVAKGQEIRPPGALFLKHVTEYLQVFASEAPKT